MRWNFHPIQSAPSPRQVLVLGFTEGNIESVSELMEEGFDLLKGQVLHTLPDQVHFQVSCPCLVADSRRPPLSHSFTVPPKPMLPLKQVQDYLSLALYFNLKQHQLALFIQTVDVKVVHNLIHNITCGLIQDHCSYHKFSPKQFIQQQTQS